jgi:tRNA (cytidine/uridine-2'-O-)-methyltransferase
VYEDYEDFKNKNIGTYYFFTRYGKKTHSDFDYSNKNENIYLIFGKESSGIDKKILKDNLDHCMRIPMTEDVRSLNLSNCAAIVVYEVLRQQNYNDLIKHEVQKGENFLEDLDI